MQLERARALRSERCGSPAEPRRISPGGPQSACAIIRYAAIGVVLCLPSLGNAEPLAVGAHRDTSGEARWRSCRSEWGVGPKGTCGPFGARALHWGSPETIKEAGVQELVQYLLKNLYLDFQGDITMEQIRQFLRQDDSREARRVLARILDEQGVDDLLLTLADCLREHLAHGINEDVVRTQLN